MVVVSMGTEESQSNYGSHSFANENGRTKTAVPVMNEHVTAKGDSSVIVNATRSVGDISHNHGQCRGES